MSEEMGRLLATANKLYGQGLASAAGDAMAAAEKLGRMLKERGL
jgi:hypothetical protein